MPGPEHSLAPLTPKPLFHLLERDPLVPIGVDLREESSVLWRAFFKAELAILLAMQTMELLSV